MDDDLFMRVQLILLAREKVIYILAYADTGADIRA
jgi:hypothetical protein